MTDAEAALAALSGSTWRERELALDAFYRRWKHEPLVLDKWFRLQAVAPQPAHLRARAALAAHPTSRCATRTACAPCSAPSRTPTRCASTRATGARTRFFAERVLAIDELNPQLAAAPGLGLQNSWKRLRAPARTGDARRARAHRRASRRCRARQAATRAISSAPALGRG
jgi:aminopeptidase N